MVRLWFSQTYKKRNVMRDCYAVLSSGALPTPGGRVYPFFFESLRFQTAILTRRYGCK